MAPRKNKKESDSSSDSGPEDRGPSKPAPKKPKTSSSKNDDEPTWSLDTKRFLKVREFNGKILVDIREYYDAGGEMKPGKKGISLSVGQWRKLVGYVDEVTKAIEEK